VRHWGELRGTDQRDALVVGNGPSRATTRAQDAIAGWHGSVIACNAYAREAQVAPDYTCCLDWLQVEVVADWALPVDAPPPRTSRGALPVLVMPPAHTCVRQPDPDLVDALGPMVVESAPIEYAATGREQVDVDARVLGNLSGQVAFQLALHLGARRVDLCGIDGSGTMRPDGRVLTSAVPPEVPGYAGASAPRQACDELADGTFVPRGWKTSIQVWRSLVRAAEARGVMVRRVLPVGALDFVESLT
jgi:hypothetical protein